MRGPTGPQSDGPSRGFTAKLMAIGAEAYNAVMKVGGDAEAAREAMRAAYAAAYDFLMKPAAFAARVERKRAEIASRSRRTVDTSTPNAPTSSLVH